MSFGASSAMRARLEEYGSHHRTRGNELCHAVGIPCIIVGAATLLGRVPVAHVAFATLTLAELVAGAIIVFYVVSGRLLGVAAGMSMALLVVLGRSLPTAVGTAAFFGGWALQFYGHAAFEKRSPAFLRNLLHLLVGPVWLVERALGRLSHAR